MTPQQRRMIFVIAGVFAVGGVAMFAYIMYVTMKSITAPPPPTGDDRRLVLTAEMLHQFGGPAPVAAAESLQTIRQFDGSRNINYEYDSRKDPSTEVRVSTSTMTMVHPTSIGAMQAFKMQEITTKAGMKLAGGKRSAKLIDSPGLLNIGDAHYAGVFRYETRPSGNLFIVRQGRVVFTVLIFGLAFDDPKEANALLLPLVEEAKKRD